MPETTAAGQIRPKSAQIWRAFQSHNHPQGNPVSIRDADIPVLVGRFVLELLCLDKGAFGGGEHLKGKTISALRGTLSEQLHVFVPLFMVLSTVKENVLLRGVKAKSGGQKQSKGVSKLSSLTGVNMKYDSQKDHNNADNSHSHASAEIRKSQENVTPKDEWSLLSRWVLLCLSAESTPTRS